MAVAKNERPADTAAGETHGETDAQSAAQKTETPPTRDSPIASDAEALKEENPEAEGAGNGDDDWEALAERTLAAPDPPVVSVREQSSIGPPPVSLQLDEDKKQVLRQARDAYLGFGGVLDEYGDVFLIRFLVAHNWKFGKELNTQLRKTVAWRANHGADEVRKRVGRTLAPWATDILLPYAATAASLEACDCVVRRGSRGAPAAQMASGELYVQFPHFAAMMRSILILPLQASTRDGDLINLLEVGTFDPPTWFRETTDKDFYKFNLYVLEQSLYIADKLSQERGKLVRLVQMYQCEGMALRHVTIPVLGRLKQVAPLLDLHYPELLGMAILTHAPGVLYKAWEIIRMWLSKALQQRVYILSAERSPQTVARAIDPAVLPVAFCGTREKMPLEVAKAIGWSTLDPAQVQDFGSVRIKEKRSSSKADSTPAPAPALRKLGVYINSSSTAS